jgi:NADPH2 dehydrogenase
MDVRRIASLKTALDFQKTLERLGIAADLAFDETVEPGPDGPMARPYEWRGGTVGNRFAILPMEGWDGTEDGRPSDLTRRRWEHFGLSGAKMIWGGEAVAVRQDGRANPNQLLINDANLAAMEGLRTLLVETHRDHFGRTDDLYVGLQLTHSGRFARPQDQRRTEPRVLYHHPCLDRKFGLAADAPVLTDDEIAHLIGDFVRA